mmetsp:Transcript_29552/g.41570  ORF Transcript_29552/g.41570 Transcript_29552/m.41570 type:complete len:129 (+) Transcript_29552:109-495(+)
MSQPLPPSAPYTAYHATPTPYLYPPVQPMGQPTQTVIIVDDRQALLQQPQQMIWGELPQRCICQFCGKQIVSSVTYEAGTLTWLVAGGLCLVGCFLGCCLIPFAVDSMKDPVHVCPHCHHQIGKKSRI